MGLIAPIITAVDAVLTATSVKILADDAREWAPWVTRRLLDLAVQRLPERRRERFSEEWRGRIHDAPGVVAKLVLAVQFLLAAQRALEDDARARLEAWRDEQAAAMTGIQASVSEMLTSLRPAGDREEADVETLLAHMETVESSFRDVIRRCDELEVRRPALGFTRAGAVFMTERTFHSIRSIIRTQVVLDRVRQRFGQRGK